MRDYNTYTQDQIKRVMLIGYFGIGDLAQSYKVAFEELGCEVLGFDINSYVEKHCRFGTLGRKFNAHVPVGAWVRKANREMVIKAGQFVPHVVVVVGSSPVMAGALAQLKASLDIILVHLWPDTLLNLDSALIECLPLYDLGCVYSQSAVKPMEKLGAACPVWLPLAGDPSLHDIPRCTESEAVEYGAEVTFIGGWRPEREALLSGLTRFKMKIWGPDWGRRCGNNSVILRAWQGRALRGLEFSKAVASSKVNLNIIDQTNYPAANMRFFEIPCAGGLQVCSLCPEMEPEFKHGETTFYYRDEGELFDQILHLLDDDVLCGKVKYAAYRRVREGHTYLHRAEEILSLTVNQRLAADANT